MFGPCWTDWNRSENSIYLMRTSISNILVLLLRVFTGKTSFALSLPGLANHFRGHWAAMRWNDDADYIVTDDIPWDKFETRGFPPHRDLLTGQDTLTVCFSSCLHFAETWLCYASSIFNSGSVAE